MDAPVRHQPVGTWLANGFRTHFVAMRDEPGTTNAFAPGDFGIGRLFMHIQDAVVVANARTERIVLWNASAENMFGYTEQEALTLPLHALVPHDLRDFHRNGIGRYQKTGAGDLIDAGNPVELRALHKEQREIPVELTLTKIPQTTRDGDRFALAIIRDVSDRKRAEQATLQRLEMERRRQHALELNDEIVQGLTVAKMAFEMGKSERAIEAVTQTLQRARAIVSGLLRDISEERGIQAGDLKRDDPADLDRPGAEEPRSG